MSMTFGAILDAVCVDGLDATRRASAKEWVRYRHTWIWGAANWTFKQATGNITFTANSQVAAAPADLHSVFAIYDSGGEPLEGIRDPRRFFDSYNTLASTSSGSPEAYAVWNGQVLVGPKGDGTTGLIVYQKTKPSLVNDGDATGLPDGFDLALVHGGKAEGYKMTNIPMSAGFDADFTAAVSAMENDWLEQNLAAGERMGAYRPGQQWPAYR